MNITLDQLEDAEFIFRALLRAQTEEALTDVSRLFEAYVQRQVERLEEAKRLQLRPSSEKDH